MQHPAHMKNPADYIFPAEVAVSILRSMEPLSEEHKVLLEEFEIFIYFRDKITAYTSEVFNTTAYASLQNDVITFYYFPPKPQLEIIVNGHPYAFAPHVDARLIPCPYNRPLRYNFDDQYANVYRKYSAVFFFNDIPPNSGGHIQWFDFPNNYNLPPANGTITGKVKDPNTGKEVFSIHSPSFADPDLKRTSIVPKRAKLIVFAAEDEVHATIAYTGEMERWACIMQLSDPLRHIDQLNNVEPAHFYDKRAPKMNSSLLKHDRQHSISSSTSRQPSSHTSHKNLRRAR